MTEMKTIRFTVTIDAPRGTVWETMLGKETYTKWTSPFCAGTYFEGTWEKGAKILFLAPGGDGMVSEIAESTPGEYVSIRHLGEVKDGVEDTTSEAVRTWAPVYENYRFSETPNGTELTVELDTMAEYEQSMRDTFPKALDLLKDMCERDG